MHACKFECHSAISATSMVQDGGTSSFSDRIWQKIEFNYNLLVRKYAPWPGGGTLQPRGPGSGPGIGQAQPLVLKSVNEAIKKMGAPALWVPLGVSLSM